MQMTKAVHHTKKGNRVTLWAVVFLFGLAACTRTVPNVPAQPNGAVIKLRYLRGSAAHPVVEGVHCFALEDFTADAQAPS